MRPVEYLEELGWLGEDVWLAHCVHLSEEEVRRFGQTKTVVEGGEFRTTDEARVAREIDAASRKLTKKAAEHVS